MTQRDPIVVIPTRYRTWACAAARPDLIGRGWQDETDGKLRMLNNPDAVGGVEVMYPLVWPHDLPANELPSGLDDEAEHIATAVAGFGGNKMSHINSETAEPVSSQSTLGDSIRERRQSSLDIVLQMRAAVKAVEDWEPQGFRALDLYDFEQCCKRISAILERAKGK